MSRTGEDGKVIAITWEQHRRTQGLAAGLHLPLHELTYRGGRIQRYLALVTRTVRLLLRERPNCLLVQNPSIVLTLLALALRPLLRYKLVVDAHNEAVQPFIHSTWPVPQLSRLLLRGADLTIVTNARLARFVEQVGGRAFVLPDRLPDVPAAQTRVRRLEGELQIMVISTYAPDEPLPEILDAAAQLGAGYRFHVTGNDRKLAPELRAQVPPNVRLTGFLPEHDYWVLMDECHVVLDLTRMPDCLVCGAYEALAFGRPMILSDDAAGRELFGDSAVFAEATPESIAAALRESRQRLEQLNTLIEPARDAFRSRWSALAQSLRGQLVHRPAAMEMGR